MIKVRVKRKDRQKIEMYIGLQEKAGWGVPWWLSGKESVCQCKRHRFNPRIKKTY